jgi:hypothetical protein
MKDKIGEHRLKIYLKFSHQVLGQVWHQVFDQVRGQVWHQVKDHVYFQLNEEIDDKR